MANYLKRDKVFFSLEYINLFLITFQPWMILMIIYCRSNLSV
jgi:hypothetical protein